MPVTLWLKPKQAKIADKCDNMTDPSSNYVASLQLAHIWVSSCLAKLQLNSPKWVKQFFPQLISYLTEMLIIFMTMISFLLYVSIAIDCLRICENMCHYNYYTNYSPYLTRIWSISAGSEPTQPNLNSNPSLSLQGALVHRKIVTKSFYWKKIYLIICAKLIFFF